jgi:hypothetical protein
MKLQTSEVVQTSSFEPLKPVESTESHDASSESHVDHLQVEFNELKKMFAVYVDEQEAMPLPNLTERKSSRIKGNIINDF